MTSPCNWHVSRGQRYVCAWRHTLHKLKKTKEIKICQIRFAVLISEVDGRRLRSVHPSGNLNFHVLSSELKSHFDFILINIQCFSNEVERTVTRNKPDHLPESMGQAFSLYLSRKLFRGIMLALKTQMNILTCKCMLSGIYTGLFKMIVRVLTTHHKQCT